MLGQPFAREDIGVMVAWLRESRCRFESYMSNAQIEEVPSSLGRSEVGYIAGRKSLELVGDIYRGGLGFSVILVLLPQHDKISGSTLDDERGSVTSAGNRDLNH